MPRLVPTGHRHAGLRGSAQFALRSPPEAALAQPRSDGGDERSEATTRQTASFSRQAFFRASCVASFEYPQESRFVAVGQTIGQCPWSGILGVSVLLPRRFTRPYYLGRTMLGSSRTAELDPLEKVESIRFSGQDWACTTSTELGDCQWERSLSNTDRPSSPGGKCGPPTRRSGRSRIRVDPDDRAAPRPSNDRGSISLPSAQKTDGSEPACITCLLSRRERIPRRSRCRPHRRRRPGTASPRPTAGP